MLYKKSIGRVILVASFLAALIWTLPLDVLLTPKRMTQNGLTASHIEGTVWKGTVKELTFFDRRVGNLHYRFDVFSLFSGKLGGPFTVQGGPVKGHGVAGLTLHRHYWIKDSSAILLLEALGYRDPTGRPIRGQLSLSIDEARFDGNMCQTAQGTLSTDALLSLADRYQMKMPVLQGSLTCEEGRFVVNLSGQNEVITMEIKADAAPSLDYTAAVTVHTTNKDLQNILIIYGFQETTDGYSLMERGNFVIGR